MSYDDEYYVVEESENKILYYAAVSTKKALKERSTVKKVFEKYEEMYNKTLKQRCSAKSLQVMNQNHKPIFPPISSDLVNSSTERRRLSFNAVDSEYMHPAQIFKENFNSEMMDTNLNDRTPVTFTLGKSGSIGRLPSSPPFINYNSLQQIQEKLSLDVINESTNIMLAYTNESANQTTYEQNKNDITSRWIDEDISSAWYLNCNASYFTHNEISVTLGIYSEERFNFRGKPATIGSLFDHGSDNVDLPLETTESFEFEETIPEMVNNQLVKNPIEDKDRNGYYFCGSSIFRAEERLASDKHNPNEKESLEKPETSSGERVNTLEPLRTTYNTPSKTQPLAVNANTKGTVINEDVFKSEALEINPNDQKFHIPIVSLKSSAGLKTNKRKSPDYFEEAVQKIASGSEDLEFKTPTKMSKMDSNILKDDKNTTFTENIPTIEDHDSIPMSESLKNENNLGGSAFYENGFIHKRDVTQTNDKSIISMLPINDNQHEVMHARLAKNSETKTDKAFVMEDSLVFSLEDNRNEVALEAKSDIRDSKVDANKINDVVPTETRNFEFDQTSNCSVKRSSDETVLNPMTNGSVCDKGTLVEKSCRPRNGASETKTQSMLPINGNQHEVMYASPAKYSRTEAGEASVKHDSFNFSLLDKQNKTAPEAKSGISDSKGATTKINNEVTSEKRNFEMQTTIHSLSRSVKRSSGGSSQSPIQNGSVRDKGNLVEQSCRPRNGASETKTQSMLPINGNQHEVMYASPAKYSRTEADNTSVKDSFNLSLKDNQNKTDLEPKSDTRDPKGDAAKINDGVISETANSELVHTLNRLAKRSSDGTFQTSIANGSVCDKKNFVVPPCSPQDSISETKSQPTLINDNQHEIISTSPAGNYETKADKVSATQDSLHFLLDQNKNGSEGKPDISYSKGDITKTNVSVTFEMRNFPSVQTFGSSVKRSSDGTPQKPMTNGSASDKENLPEKLRHPQDSISETKTLPKESSVKRSLNGAFQNSVMRNESIWDETTLLEQIHLQDNLSKTKTPPKECSIKDTSKCYADESKIISPGCGEAAIVRQLRPRDNLPETATSPKEPTSSKNSPKPCKGYSKLTVKFVETLKERKTRLRAHRLLFQQDRDVLSFLYAYIMRMGVAIQNIPSVAFTQTFNTLVFEFGFKLKKLIKKKNSWDLDLDDDLVVLDDCIKRIAQIQQEIKTVRKFRNENKKPMMLEDFQRWEARLRTVNKKADDMILLQEIRRPSMIHFGSEIENLFQLFIQCLQEVGLVIYSGRASSI